MPRPGHKNSKFSQKREPKEFDEEVIQIDRVTRVVKGGRKLRFRATVAIGNRKGKVGVGVGKSHEVTGAIQKGIAKAKKDLLQVKLDGVTIPHDVKIKYKSAKILLLPAAPGTGIIAGGTIRKVLELAGVKDILSKTYGTTNKVNNTKAIFKALQSLKNTPFMKFKAEKEAKEKREKEEKQKAGAKGQPEPKPEKKPEPKKEAPEVKKEAPEVKKEAPEVKKPEPKKEEPKKQS
jgi:small subunit ribosomal protein S5